MSLGGSTYGASVPRDFRLLSLFLFHVHYLSFLFLFHLRSLLLRLFRFLLLFFLSLSSTSFTMPIGTLLRRHYPPSSAMVAIAGGAATVDSADTELIASFRVQ
jgi:hypothetical protein